MRRKQAKDLDVGDVIVDIGTMYYYVVRHTLEIANPGVWLKVINLQTSETLTVIYRSFDCFEVLD